MSFLKMLLFTITMMMKMVTSVVDVDRCTTIAVALGAGSEGPMSTHTSDCSSCDFRIAKVPARDWPKGSMRPLYEYRGEYPATVSPHRGETWNPNNLEGTPEQIKGWGNESKITGYIPQVEHTFGLYESGYGIMNEHQVGIGESTCAGKLWAPPTTAGGKAMIEVREMSRIALERSRTARDAVRLMGDLATKYGFYGADWSGGDASLGEAGEALTVVDKYDAWVFHVMADDSGTSAIWVAQKLPYGHVAAVANQFVIRKVDRWSPDFMFSDNLWDVAKRNGFWKEEDGDMDFLKTYAPKRAHSTYCTRRVWRVLDLVAPSLKLPADTDPFADDYPFSVPVDKQISPADLMRIQRDHYEGSKFDLTEGLAAGPYGDPNRFDSSPQPMDNLTRMDIVQGSYERAISLFRTSYSFVAVARTAVPDSLSLLWFAQYAPSSASYVPLYVGARKAPSTHMTGSLFKFDNNVAFWNFLVVGNYASRFYKYAMAEVTSRFLALEQQTFAAVKDSELKLMANPSVWYNPTALEADLTKFTHDQAHKITNTWKEMLPEIITKYHDGYIATDLDKTTINMQKIFYPKFWLDLTGFWDSKINTGPDVILFASRDTERAAHSSSGSGLIDGTAYIRSNSPAVHLSFASFVMLLLVTVTLSVMGGVYFARKQQKRVFLWEAVTAAHEYIQINNSVDSVRL